MSPVMAALFIIPCKSMISQSMLYTYIVFMSWSTAVEPNDQHDLSNIDIDSLFTLPPTTATDKVTASPTPASSGNDDSNTCKQAICKYTVTVFILTIRYALGL